LRQLDGVVGSAEVLQQDANLALGIVGALFFAIFYDFNSKYKNNNKKLFFIT
jgi:hypothetical protein